MDGRRYLYFTGTAGAGKSSLVAAMAQWCELHDIDKVIVNLDPGAEEVPYEPDIDIREMITLTEIMKDTGLGPNGAQIMAADLLAFQLPAIEEALEEFPAPFVLIDTAGQVELFAFREASRSIINQLGFDEAALIYLMDPMLARTASGYITQMMLSNIVSFRLMVPMRNVLSKMDLLDEEKKDRILGWSAEPDRLYDDLLAQEASMNREFAISQFRVFEENDFFRELIPTSADNGHGMEDIYSFVQSVISAGEDLDVEVHPDFRE